MNQFSRSISGSMIGLREKYNNVVKSNEAEAISFIVEEFNIYLDYCMN